MNQLRRFAWAILAGLSLSGAVPASANQEAVGSTLVGAWALVSVDNLLPDGTRVELYGPRPQGLLMFDVQGRYSLHILRADRARFASADKAKGTADEFAQAVRGSNSHYGRYSVDLREGTITFHIDHAMFPNWEGTQQKRAFKLTNGSLIYSVPTPTSGGSVTGEVEWRRSQ